MPWFSYFQFDSWWYYKGLAGGVKLWEPRPDVFPHGLGYVNIGAFINFFATNIG